MERILSINALISFILTNRVLAVIRLLFMTSLSKLKNGQKCGLKGSDILILGDPGAVSPAGLKGATKVLKHGRKSPWVPTLTGPFPNGQENDGS